MSNENEAYFETVVNVSLVKGQRKNKRLYSYYFL